MSKHLVRTRAALAAGVLVGLGMASTPAWSTIALSSNDAGGPEMALFVWDTTTKIGYIRDLGSQWLPSTVSTVFGSNLSYGADANYSAFLTANGGITSTTYWGVYSDYYLAQQGVELAGMVPSLTAKGYTTGFESSLATAFNSVITYEISGGTNTDWASRNAVNGSTVTTASQNAFATWSQGFGTSGTNTFRGKISTGQTTLNFWELTSGASAVSTESVTKLAGVWALDAVTGSVTYTVPSVPEPQSSWLLLAGLGVIGLMSKKHFSKSV